jgi:hypothetical protein
MQGPERAPNDIEQFRAGSKQVILWPAEYKTCKMIYPYGEARNTNLAAGVYAPARESVETQAPRDASPEPCRAGIGARARPLYSFDGAA